MMETEAPLPLSMSSHLMGTKLPPQAIRASPESPCRTRTEINDQPNHSLTKAAQSCILLSSAPILLYLNLKLMSVPQTWAEMLDLHLPRVAMLIKILSTITFLFRI
jgi:hypothetical protein